MAKTIGQLTQTTTLDPGDEFVIEQSGLTKRIAASVVRGGLVDADIDAAADIAGSKLADDAITTAKIDDDAVTTAKIDDDAVTTAKIAAAAKVGTVTESGGSPTGAIMESGSNADGRFIKFADGTMICSHRIESTASNPLAWTYPSAFLSATVPVVIASPEASTARFASVNNITNTSADIYRWNDAGSASGIFVFVMAMGKWF